MQRMPENRGHFHALDKKGGGREISQLLPKHEHFSRLYPGKDIVSLKKNREIETDVNLDDFYFFINPKKGTDELTVEAPHWRTVSKENIKAYYNHGRIHEPYYTVNVKGVGYLKPTLKGAAFDDWDEWWRIDEHGQPGGFGLADKDDFFAEDGDLIAKSKYLTDAGVRTELYYSFGRLKNVYYKGELTSVKDLRRQGVIPNKHLFVPHMGIRLIKSNNRIAEVKESDYTRARELFQKAFEIYNKEIKDKKLTLGPLELGRPRAEKMFFNIFFKRMAKNMAIFQNLGYIGWQLHSANITLAAEIVDIGPYQPWRVGYNSQEFIKKYQGVRRGVWKDFRDTAYDLRYMYQAGQNAGLSLPDRDTLVRKFMESFSRNLKNSYLRRERVKRSDLEKAFASILNAVLLQKRRLRALKHGAEVTDWGVLGQ